MTQPIDKIYIENYPKAFEKLKLLISNKLLVSEEFTSTILENFDKLINLSYRMLYDLFDEVDICVHPVWDDTRDNPWMGGVNSEFSDETFVDRRSAEIWSLNKAFSILENRLNNDV